MPATDRSVLAGSPDAAAPAGCQAAPVPGDGTPPSARLFVGLWPDAAALDGVRRWQAACGWPPGARPVPATKVHLTLHFLGAVERAQLPALGGALDVPAQPFELVLGRAVLWPGGVAVLEPPDGVPPPLAALHARLGEALRSLGLPTEARPFRPHATLARRAAGAALPAHAAPVRWPASGHVLVESDRGYRVLREFRWPHG